MISVMAAIPVSVTDGGERGCGMRIAATSIST